MKRLIILILPLLLLFGGCALADDASPALILTALNVGKADCLLLECGSSLYMIDTGTGESWGAVSAFLTERRITHLSGVIITHTDSDHVGGAAALASSSIAIDGWYASAFCAKFKDSKNPAMLAAAMRGERVTLLSQGDSLPLDGGTLTVLGPTEYSDKENNNSIVLLAEAAGGSMLLAGDMEFPEEDLLLSKGLIPACTVLKVGNHGENDATSAALVSTVRPQIAVISTNSVEEPDTPSTRVLKLLKSVGAQIALTQSASGGVQVVVRDGSAQTVLFSHDVWPDAVRSLALTGKDNAADVVSIANTGTESVDISGWFLRSERGGEILVLPQGTTIAAGQTLLISTLSSSKAGAIVWKEKNVWHDKKDDAAILFDAYGREISRAD